jgi:ubiquinone/menaquinone biosynthesis C-methylase UbiE
MIPDWQLPPGVDRGVWDYIHATEMISEYDATIGQSPLAAADVAFCERHFPTPGRLVDLGCGTGRLCRHFATKGYECWGIDLSDEMLAKARSAADGLPIRFLKANLVELSELPSATFDYAACLFSTLGMVRGAHHRKTAVATMQRLLRPGGRLALHVHNRFFRGLGWHRVLGQRWKWLTRHPDAGDLTMPQSYGGAPLTLHHFTRREAVHLLKDAGFTVREVLGLGITGLPASRSQIYGWLLLGER